MADTKLTIFQSDGTTAAIDYRTESTNGDGRQVVVLGDPTSNNATVAVQASDPTSNTEGLVVRDVNTSAIVSRLGSTLNVQLDPGHTLGSISGIGSSVAVYFSPSTPSVAATFSGSMAVYFDQSSPTVKAVPSTGTTFNVQFDPGHTLGSVLVNPGTGTLNVQFDPGHEVGSIKGVNSTVTVKLDPGYELGSIRGINSSINAYIGGTAGTLVVKLDPAAYALTNAFHTAGIFTVSGSTSGVSASGVTLVSPSANYSFKVYAYSLMTTGLVSMTAKFVNGSGGGQTVFWTPLVTSTGTTQQFSGANFGVQPPGFLFATGTSTTLALLLDTASLVHYSVSYIKETA